MYACVLVLAGIEIIFIVANMGLCFGFVLKTALIIEGRFHYCWAVLTESQGLFCCSHHPTSKLARSAQEAGRGRSQDSWPELTKGIFHTLWCHVQRIKLGEVEGRGGCLEWWCLSSQVSVTHDGALLCWRWLNTCLLMGSSEWIHCFSLFVCAQLLLYLLNCPYLILRVFSPLPFHFSPLSHRGEVDERLYGA